MGRITAHPRRRIIESNAPRNVASTAASLSLPATKRPDEPTRHQSPITMSVARIRAFARPALTKRFSSTMQPRFSPGTNESATTAALTPLLASSTGESGGKWALAADGEALERSFTFKNFAKTWVRLSCRPHRSIDWLGSCVLYLGTHICYNVYGRSVTKERTLVP